MGSSEEAVKDKYLVPPEPISVPLKFQREGIKYVELSEEEKEEWDELDWDEEGNIPDRVVSDAVNKWLFNKWCEADFRRVAEIEGPQILNKLCSFKQMVFLNKWCEADFRPAAKTEGTRILNKWCSCTTSCQEVAIPLRMAKVSMTRKSFQCATSQRKCGIPRLY